MRFTLPKRRIVISQGTSRCQTARQDYSKSNSASSYRVSAGCVQRCWRWTELARALGNRSRTSTSSTDRGRAHAQLFLRV
ncbi:hypothetical protein C8R43DRAFT_1132044 [Mycena crocata]|nr:hypothetical protein C8R43DRAFT_1132044 [Mycena crocata]